MIKYSPNRKFDRISELIKKTHSQILNSKNKEDLIPLWEKKRKHPEDNLLKACIQYTNSMKIVREKRIVVLHPCNEQKITKIQGYRLNQKGREKGACDIFVFHRNKKYIGFASELKTFPKKLTNCQLDIVDRLRSSEWYVAAPVYTIDEYMKEIDNYFLNV